MWRRFGTPTPRADSGTEEEFNNAYRKYIDNSNNVRIMFYFNQAPINPKDIDPAQIEKIQEFQDKLQEKGVVYWTYNGSENFATLIRMHLNDQVQNWGKTWGNKTEELLRPKIAEDDSETGNIKEESEKNGIEIDEEEELGFLDYIELGQDKLAVLMDNLNRMTSAIQTLGENVQKRGKELTELQTSSRTPNVKAAKRIVQLTALDMNQFVERMEVEIPIFSESYSTGVDAIARAATITPDFNKGEAQLLEALANIQKMKTPLTSTMESMEKFRGSVQSIPRMSRDIIKAKNRTISTLDNLIEEMVTAENLTTETEKTLENNISQLQKQN
jgi:hypothetical protein